MTFWSWVGVIVLASILVAVGLAALFKSAPDEYRDYEGEEH